MVGEEAAERLRELVPVAQVAQLQVALVQEALEALTMEKRAEEDQGSARRR